MNPLFHQLFQQNRYMVNRLNDVLAQHELYSSQWTILFLLEQKGPMTLTAIWKYLNVEAPTVTRTVTRLEKLGWVTREQGADKREKIIHLTEMAHVRFPQIAASVKDYEREMTQHLTQEEQQQLMDLLQKMKA
ncbi:MAG: MarR family transcriptional regulator [Solibacillus sp.]